MHLRGYSIVSGNNHASQFTRHLFRPKPLVLQDISPSDDPFVPACKFDDKGHVTEKWTALAV